MVYQEYISFGKTEAEIQQRISQSKTENGTSITADQVRRDPGFKKFEADLTAETLPRVIVEVIGGGVGGGVAMAAQTEQEIEQIELRSKATKISKDLNSRIT
jgi:hypothetical protein